MEKYTAKKIDYIDSSIETIEPAHSSATLALELGKVAIDFASIERVPRYSEQHRENDAEHSFMLALVANELARTLYPTSIDAGLVTQYSMVHDLIELKTGDVATFNLDSTELANKEALEHAALQELLEQLPPFTRDLVHDYEQQSSLEARFVRAVDKLLPIVVDILGAGRKVMNEDYGISTVDELQVTHRMQEKRMAERFHEFPHIIDGHALLGELFEIEFGITPTPPRQTQEAQG